MLQDQEITLKPLQIKDAEAIFGIIDRNRAIFRKYLPWVDATHEVRDSKMYIQSVARQKEHGTGAFFAIWVDEKIVGVIAFTFIQKQNRKGHIGYWMDASFHGKGVMTRACRLLISYGFRELKLHRIESGCAVDNTKSCAVLTRSGFVQEGVFRDVEWLHDHFVDHNFFSILEQDWTKHPLT